MGVRKSGQGVEGASSSMIYALTQKQGKERPMNYGTSNAIPNVGGSQNPAGNNMGGGTPIRGNSGSMRRKLVAQQGHQHFKKALGTTGQSNTFRDGTPKERQNQIPQIGIGATTQPNRIKSSRLSERTGTTGASSVNVNQQRAITPKQGQKLYQSINVNKNTRNSSHTKITNAAEPYMTQQAPGISSITN